ncbi:MAG: sensor histidine kinase [Streptosporangiaceae bacterium]
MRSYQPLHGSSALTATAANSLLDNAVRFTREGDSIELSVRSCGGEAAVTVADSGPGIPDGQLEWVFDRFDGSGSGRDSSHNFGLGLSIVRAIAETHGGRVAAARSPAGGAAVTIWLPLYQPAVGFVAEAERHPVRSA